MLDNFPPSHSRSRLKQFKLSHKTACSSKGREFKYTMRVGYNRYNTKTQLGNFGYSQKTLQNKNIHKYKIQMIYFWNYTGTPAHLLAQFLEIL